MSGPSEHSLGLTKAFEVQEFTEGLDAGHYDLYA